jgi:hypothetical protein
MTSSNRIIPSQYELLETTTPPPSPEEEEDEEEDDDDDDDDDDEEDGEDESTNADAYDWRYPPLPDRYVFPVRMSILRSNGSALDAFSGVRFANASAADRDSRRRREVSSSSSSSMIPALTAPDA